MLLLSLVVALVLLSVLFANYLLVIKFGFTRDNFLLLTSFLLLFGLALFWFFASAIFENLFAGQGRLKKMLRKTLHELNTPVATIEMNAKMLRRALQDDEKLLKKLDRIDGSCKNLLQLYEDMEYSIKKEVYAVEADSFDLREAVAKSIDKFRDIKGDIEVQNLVKPLELKCDKKGFSTVLDNLLSNGIKYNTSGGYVKFYMKGSVLCIEDSGRGIDTKNLFVVFDRYYQEDSTQSGFGMGLALVKEFCDRNKIALNIESSENRGTTIMLDLHHCIEAAKPQT